MKHIKVRKIGNSIGIILPKESGLQVGDLLGYQHDDHKIVLDAENVGKEQDRHLIEESFADFDNGQSYSEAEIQNKFSKDGWGSANG